MSELRMEAADAVIVGAGLAGAVAAKRLVEAGMSVVCLEQGPWPDYDKARAKEKDFELSREGPYWTWNPNRRHAESDYPINESESDVSPLMWNGVGGSTLLYGAAWHRIKPSDFRVKTLDGVGDDWPLTYRDLAPYYERVERDMAVSGIGGDPAYPDGIEYAMGPSKLGSIGERVVAGHNRLGWHWWPGSNAIATRDYGALKACARYGVCMWGCPERAKASTDLTHWPALQEKGVRLVTGARVARIELDDKGRATGVEYVARDGSHIFQRASVVILAANAIGTPRLLLASASAKFPDGIANSSGLVGKRLMMHPYGTVVGVFEDVVDSTRGLWGQRAYSMQFYETDTSRGFVRGAKWQLMPAGGPLDSATAKLPWGYKSIFGDTFHDAVGERFGHSAYWGIMAEDLPNEENRVVLDQERTDSDGIPIPKLIYRTAENTAKLLAFHTARASESMLEAGAKKTVVAPVIRETGWHHLGTAKMGDDPATSVVDRWGRSHDVPNLYITDGSIWPTSSGVNPAGTVAAMALWVADHLVETRHGQEVPA